jgi:YebC/PmpR family DNA-binding regulatory protein
MSGHSKWSTIKRAKGITDAKRSSLFTKLSKNISVAARLGGADPEMNFKLRLAIDKARAANMPNDNVDRAIKKGAGGGEGAALESVTYEAYGPGGVAMLIDAVTDNKNRTVSDLRANLNKFGGRLAESGSTAWMFETQGVLTAKGSDLAALELAAIDAGATDIEEQEKNLRVLTDPKHLTAVRAALEKAGATVEDVDIIRFAKTTVPLADENTGPLTKLLDALDDHDDIDDITTNAEHDPRDHSGD